MIIINANYIMVNFGNLVTLQHHGQILNLRIQLGCSVSMEIVLQC